jgi:hypothetical protein
MKDRPQTGWLERRLVPVPLCAGAVVAFFACCLLGRWWSARDPYVGVERFDGVINPQSFFYPTAAQLCTHARRAGTPDEVLVLVGGNSILHGIGLPAEEMWTTALQRDLGPAFRVVNLAFPGALPNEAGGVVAEVLARESRRVIFVTDVGSSTLQGKPDGLTYRYLFWDAFERGLLAASPERDDALRAELAAHTEKEREAVAELRRDRWLNTRLGHQEFWTAFTYLHANTIWWPDGRFNRLWAAHHGLRTDTLWAKLLLQGYSARRRLIDPISAGEWERYPAHLHEESMGILRTFKDCCPSLLLGAPFPPPSQRAALRVDPESGTLVRSCREVFAPPLRSRMLILSMHDSPYYVEQLTPAEQVDYQFCHALMVRTLEAGGFAALEAGGNFGKDDFLDRCHLSEEGGRKLARQVAAKVRSLAHGLGYLPEDSR